MYFSLQRKLTFIYLAALGLIALLTLASYFIVHYSLEEKTNDARIINISGQQSTLSQKIVKVVFLLSRTENPVQFKQYQESLKEELALWEQFHQGLQFGDITLGLPQENNPTIKRMFEQIEPHYQSVKSLCTRISRFSSPEKDSLQSQKITGLLDSLLYHEDNYLDLMNTITFKYDQEVNRKLDQTKNTEFYLVLITLFVLVLEGFFIFRPVVNTTARQWEEIHQSKNELEQLNSILKKSEEENRKKALDLKTNEEEIRQNLEELEAMNESLVKTSEELRHKNEVLKEATEVLDLKNRQIRENRDQIYEQSQLIEDKNRNITQSLRYAKRIQEAIIPNPAHIVTHFKDAFLLFHPRDIVSGDFYWFHEQGQRKIIIAADCTGHGVPGALMTMIGNSLLNEIINTSKPLNPSEILCELDKKLIETLQKRSGDGKPIHDGMDMAVLSIDTETRHVEFAAAHNPLFYIHDGEVDKIKGSKFPVGSAQYKSDKIFELNSFQAAPNSALYIFTDGYQDQYGEQAKRKYMSKRFRNYLLLISHLPMSEQLQKLTEEFEEWKGNGTQTDDLLVIGIRL
ncbi:MAG: SpoIIE family protein phosphatase [Microscillaceae bacterium]|nr:SpoIIE family protein phosphatase [Microscillaceae bacterium]